MAQAALTGKTVLVTGATAGIGLATARALAVSGADVIVVGRDRARTEAAAVQVAQARHGAVVTPLVADLTSMAAVRRLAGEVRARWTRLDVLVNNAGAMFGERLLTPEGFERTWALNHLSCLLLTVELLPLLRASAPARVVNVSSMTHAGARMSSRSHGEMQRFSGLQAYSQAKLAQVLCGYALARRLKGTGVTVNALHPGVVATDVAREMGPLFSFMQKTLLRPFASSPDTAARTSVYLATSPDVEGVTGGYFVKSTQRRSSADSYDEALQERIWSTSLAKLGLANVSI
ncbi:MAG: SDR family oxidoreductase [Vicinamibacterales bacterium]|nr:SDR family oxidoreductase [Vicinamibacterales bacterium]